MALGIGWTWNANNVEYAVFWTPLWRSNNNNCITHDLISTTTLVLVSSGLEEGVRLYLIVFSNGVCQMSELWGDPTRRKSVETGHLERYEISGSRSHARIVWKLLNNRDEPPYRLKVLKVWLPLVKMCKSRMRSIVDIFKTKGPDLCEPFVDIEDDLL